VDALVLEVALEAIERQEQAGLREAHPGHHLEGAGRALERHGVLAGDRALQAVCAGADHALGSPHAQMGADVVPLLADEHALVGQPRAPAVAAGLGEPLFTGREPLT